MNLGKTHFGISVGQKIAQLLVVPIYSKAVAFVDSLEELSTTERGSGGFGSTGHGGR